MTANPNAVLMHSTYCKQFKITFCPCKLIVLFCNDSVWYCNLNLHTELEKGLFFLFALESKIQPGLLGLRFIVYPFRFNFVEMKFAFFIKD